MKKSLYGLFIEATRIAGKLLPLRRRYLLTRAGYIRFRFVVSAFTFLILTITISALLSARNGVAAHPGTQKFAALSPASGESRFKSTENQDHIFEYYAARQKRLAHYFPQNDEPKNTPIVIAAPVVANKQIKEERFKIGVGDTLSAVMAKAGLTGTEAYMATKSMAEYLDPRRIKPGQEIYLRFTHQSNEAPVFKELEIVIDPLKSVKLNRSDKDSFKAELLEQKPVKRRYVQKATIETSLYGSAAKAGIPIPVITDAIYIYSWDVDFQRDIRRGDTIEIMYERLETEEGIAVKNGDILYAKLSVNGHDIPIYRFETKDGRVDYFGMDGRSVRKTLMKTPIDGARISSGYGARRHPVLGYNKMHKGIDFAASRGTPIYAAGDGIVEKAGKWSSYGNYLRIRHNSSLKTAYAHLKGFAKGVRSGARVKQGQIVGYVGTTGRSTGAHLHYEVLKNGVQINPRTLKLPQGETLKGKQLLALQAHIKKVDQLYASLSQNVKYAALQ